MTTQTAKYFEDIEPGDDLGPLMRTPTSEKVSRFQLLSDPTGAPSRFTSDEVAKKQGLPFALVPGIMCTAYLNNFLTTSIHGAQVKRLDTVYRQSVPHDKPVRLVGIVTGKNVVNGEHQVECDIYIQREDKENMVTGNAVVVVPSRGHKS